MSSYNVELKGGTITPKIRLIGAEVYPVSGGGGGANLETKSASYTPSELAIQQTLTPSIGYDGFDKVNVSVDAISSTYVGSGIARKDSTDLTASGATVTAPAGYYASNATKTIPNASTPTVNFGGINASGDLIVDVDVTDGGYIADGTYQLTETTAVTSKAAATYTPGTTDQTIAAGQWLYGNQTILGDADLVAGNIKKDVQIFGVTGTYEGGGVSEEPMRDVNFIDYDGTIVYSYSFTDFDALSDLPANPTHTGMVAQGWNWTLADAKAEVLANPTTRLWIGQTYTTQSGGTEFDIEIEAPRLSPMLRLVVNGTVNISWGDGTTETMSGTNLTTAHNLTHNYAEGGKYTITITPTSGSEYKNVDGSNFLNRTTEGASNENNRYYAMCIKRVRFGAGISALQTRAFQMGAGLESVSFPLGFAVAGYAFYNCTRLFGLVLPSGLTEISTYAFSGCSNAARISIPKSVTTISGYAFQNTKSVSFTLPSGVASLGNYVSDGANHLELNINGTPTFGTYAFQNSRGHRRVVIKEGVTGIPNTAFGGNSSMTYLSLPSTITSIAANAFNAPRNLKEFHIKATTPPTLSNTNAFTGIESDAVIYVPYSADQSVLNAYKTASNWSSYASYMQEEPQ